ncbi:MAG: hypothetical protein QNJ57_11940 [Flavobacteriaceae bacterium]|nr:hypothetical protein [Flavobacteriaceae bacterium]
MTEKHHLLTNDEFEEQFASCTLPACYFTHEAHLRLAYIHIKRYGVKQAIKNISRQIINFDDKYGDGTKFNKRITIASAKVVEHFMEKTSALDFKGMLLEFPQLRSNFCDVLKKHYKLDFFKKENEEAYLETDLLAVN